MPEPYKGKGILFKGELSAESLVRQLQLSNFNNFDYDNKESRKTNKD